MLIVFFFILLFLIDDFVDLNFQIDFFKFVSVSNYSKKLIFLRVSKMTFFTNFQLNTMSQILKNSNYDRFLLLLSIEKRKAIFKILIKLKKIVNRKTTSLTIFINFIKKIKKAFENYNVFIYIYDNYSQIYEIYEKKKRTIITIETCIRSKTNEKKRKTFS